MGDSCSGYNAKAPPRGANPCPMTEPHQYSASGSVFALFDELEGGWPGDPAQSVAELCASHEPSLAGVVLIGPPRAGGDARMRTYAHTGERLPACAGGMRTFARHLVETDRFRGDELVLETDAGSRRVRPLVLDGKVHSVSVDMGTPQVVVSRQITALDDQLIETTSVRVGGRHVVAFVEDLEGLEVDRLGRELAAKPAFANAYSFCFASQRGSVVSLRTWRPGSNEVIDCGASSCATAVAGIQLGMLVSPVWVVCGGWTLEVEWRRFGTAWLTGSVFAGVELDCARDNLSAKTSDAGTRKPTA